MMKSMQIIERSRRLLYLYTANVTESRRIIFSLTLVYEELLETSLSSYFSTILLKRSCLKKNFASNARSQNIKHVIVLSQFRCMKLQQI